MNHRLQPFPHPALVSRRSKSRGEPARPLEADGKIFRSWLVYDTEWKRKGIGVNWNVVLGLGTAVILSIGFWTVMGVVFARWLR